MENNEIGKAKMINNVDVIEYVPKSVAFKTIIKKTTGNIRIISFDTREMIPGKIIAFDNYVEIIDGKAEIIIDGISNLLITDQSIVIPAHTSNSIKAMDRFKMISTIIKSGYED